MIALGHAGSGVVAGIAVITFMPEPVPVPLLIADSFVIGMLLHYLGDFLPHGHYRFDLQKRPFSSLFKLFIDLFISSGILAYLAYLKYGFNSELLIIGFTMMGALMPDVIEEMANLSKKPNIGLINAHRAFHYDILHWHNQPQSPLEGGALPLRWIDIWQFGVYAIGVQLLI